MTEVELTAKLALLGQMDEDILNKIVCALIGHSRIQTTFWGYFHCGRCEEQLGDQLGAVYNAERVVIVGHDCELCRMNYAKLSWEDKFHVADPFVKETDTANKA